MWSMRPSPGMRDKKMQRWDQRWRQGQDQEEEIVQEKKELIRILRETPRGRLKYDRQWGQDQSGEERGTHLGTEMEGETSIGDMMKRSSSLHPSSPLLVPDGPASGHVWHSVMEEVAEEMLEMKLQTIAGVAKELEMKEKKGEREGEEGRKEMRGSPQGNPPGETSSSTSRSKHKRKDPAPHKISKSQVTNPVPTSPVDATLHMMDLKLNQELQSAKMNRRRSTLERRRELWEETEAKKREKSKELELENQRKEEALEKEVARLKREQEQEMRELQNLQKKRLEDLRAARAERKIADDHIKATATLEEAIERMKALAQKVELDPHPAEALKNSLTVLQTLKEYGPDPKLILAANTAAVAIEKLVETISIDLAAAAEEEEERLQRAQAEAIEAEKARKAEEERTRKQKEEAERQQQQLKLQKQQLEQQAQASVQPEISQANLERLQAVMNHKARVSAAADEMANNPALKRFRGDCQKVISTTVNEINAQSSEFLRKKLETLRLAITGQQVSLGESVLVQPGQHPGGVPYCMDTLAKKLVNSCDSVVMQQQRYSYAAVIVSLWADSPDFGLTFLAHVYEACPFLIPRHVRRMENQSEDDFMRALGYKSFDGKMEKPIPFSKRMGDIARLYAAVTVSRLPSRQSASDHPHGLGNIWRWIASVMNLNPIVDVTPTMLHSVLEVAGHALFEKYGAQFKKLLVHLVRDYLPRIEEISFGGSKASVEMLKQFLEPAIQSGTIKKPEKPEMLPLDYI